MYLNFYTGVEGRFRATISLSAMTFASLQSMSCTHPNKNICLGRSSRSSKFVDQCVGPEESHGQLYPYEYPVHRSI
jgi:hypothetical protein